MAVIGLSRYPRRGGSFTGLQNTIQPQQLPSFAAWYDASDLSSFIVDSSNRVALWSDKSGNSAVNCLVLNGVAGNYASAPDSVPLDITGDIDLRAYLLPVSWASGGTQVVLSKDNAAAQRSYDLFLTATGTIGFLYTADGSTLRNSASSVAVGFSALNAGWIRATYANATGKVNYYTSTDGATWTQLGIEQSLTAGAIFSGSAEVRVGCNGTGTGASLINGLVYRAQIYNGIAGTLAFDFDPSVAAKLAGTVTERSANAATVTINTTGATGARISGARDLYQGLAANQPIYLPWSGTNYGYLNGSATTNFSTPDAAALDVTGDIEVIVRATLPDWTPAAQMCLLGKYDTGATQRSYGLFLEAAGNLTFNTSVAGGAPVAAVSTAATGLADGATKWIKVTRDVDNGAGGNSTMFYLSDDGATWTQLGTTVVVVGTTSIHAGTAALTVGSSLNSGAASVLLTGNVLRAQVLNGIAGTLVFDFNPAAYVSGTTFLDSSANAATITLNGGSTIVTRSCLYFDGSNDYLKTAAFALAQPETVYFVGSQVTWTANRTFFDGNAVNTMRLYQLTASPSYQQLAATDGGAQTGLALATRAVLSLVYNGAGSSNRVNRLAAVAGNVGAGDPNGFTLGVAGSTTQPSNITVSEVLVYAAAQGLSFQDRVIMWLLRKWGIVG